MLRVTLTVFFTTAIFAVGISHLEDFLINNAVYNGQLHSRRQTKFFPFFSVVRFANVECSANNNFVGTCFTRRECINYGGTPSGSCANGLGTCCVFQKTCGSTTNLNNTYFINPNYPSTYRGENRCKIIIQRCNSNICQLRLDFLDFSFSQPNASGICDNDLFLVTGGASAVPRLCGENTNQHVYVDFNEANPITISIDTTASALGRRWNIRIQQIACDSVWRAPNGCLQYYTAVTGAVSSFNFGASPNSRAPMYGTREMANLHYGACVKASSGYCTIEWSQSSNDAFSVSGYPGATSPSLVGTSSVAESGVNCTKDFVIVPNPQENGTDVAADRFCGNGFVTKTTSLRPFVLYVVTDGDEINELQNKGFLLIYRQLPCAV